MQRLRSIERDSVELALDDGRSVPVARVRDPRARRLKLSGVPSEGTEPTEGFVVGRREGTIVVQTFDSLGKSVPSAAIVPDAEGFFATVIARLSDVIHRSESYC